jgi:hypothetical protein
MKNKTLVQGQPFSPSQLKALRVARAFLEGEELEETKIRVKFIHSGSLQITLEYQRADCEEYSWRNVLCKKYLSFIVSPRGKLNESLVSCYFGTSDFSENFINHYKVIKGR